MNRRRFLQFFFALVIFLPSCVGGGTDGTGGVGLMALEGMLSMKDGSPIAGAEVAVVGTDSKTKTAQDGSFSLQAPTGNDGIDLEIIGVQAKGHVKITGVPKDMKGIKMSVKIVYDPATGSLEIHQSTEIAGDIEVNGGELSINNVKIHGLGQNNQNLVIDQNIKQR